MIFKVVPEYNIHSTSTTAMMTVDWCKTPQNQQNCIQKGGPFAKYFCLFPHSGKSFVFFLTFSGFCLLFNTFVLS
jgi:hypothetical protein